MRGAATTKDIVEKIKILRSRGMSIQEISVTVGKSKSIVSRYIQGVLILPKYLEILKKKQGGSKERSRQEWVKIGAESKKIITDLTPREKLLILASLYWGEGTKRELNIINSDSAMMRVVVKCLKELGIPSSEFRATLRVYGDVNQKDAITYWSKSIDLPLQCFINVNVLSGKKDGRLKYGMCRIRVVKGGRYFKLIMSIIERIKELLP